MIATVEAVSTAKPRRRTAAKASARPAATKVKATLLLSEEASQRLGVHATMLGVDRSALVDELIRTHLRRFRIQDLDRNDSRDTGEDRQASPAA